jgi:predicted site-specific integrase-resolvase
METELPLTIQQVASATGLSVHTLRYYERNGLIEPIERAANKEIPILDGTKSKSSQQPEGDA